MQKSSKFSDSARNLAEIRRDIDALTEPIFCALAERKKLSYNGAPYLDNSGTLSVFYAELLSIICRKDANARMTPQIRAVDAKAIFIIQKRIELGAEAIALKKKSGMPKRDTAREKELRINAGKTAEKYCINAKAGEKIMMLIVKEALTSSR